MASSNVELGKVAEHVSLISKVIHRIKVHRQNFSLLAQRADLVALLVGALIDESPALSSQAIDYLKSLDRTLHKAKTFVQGCHKWSRIYLLLQGEFVVGQLAEFSSELDNSLRLIPLQQLPVSDDVLDQIYRVSATLKATQFKVHENERRLSLSLRGILGRRIGQLQLTEELLSEFQQLLGLRSPESWRREEEALKRHHDDARADEDAMEERYIQGILSLLKKAEEECGSFRGMKRDLMGGLPASPSLNEGSFTSDSGDSKECVDERKQLEESGRQTTNAEDRASLSQGLLTYAAAMWPNAFKRDSEDGGGGRGQPGTSPRASVDIQQQPIRRQAGSSPFEVRRGGRPPSPSGSRGRLSLDEKDLCHALGNDDSGSPAEISDKSIDRAHSWSNTSPSGDGVPSQVNVLDGHHQSDQQDQGSHQPESQNRGDWSGGGRSGGEDGNCAPYGVAAAPVVSSPLHVRSHDANCEPSDGSGKPRSGQWRHPPSYVPRAHHAGGMQEPPAPSRQETPSMRTIEEIPDMVKKLRQHQEEQLSSILDELRLLTKVNDDARRVAAEVGGIPPVVRLLDSSDDKVVEGAVTVLLNLSLRKENKDSIVEAGALPGLVRVLETGNMVARENAAAAAFSLSTVDNNKRLIAKAGAIPPLVKLLQEGRPSGQRDAIVALFNLSLAAANKLMIVQAGAIPPLLNVVAEFTPCAQGAENALPDKAVTLLSSLTVIREGQDELVDCGGIPLLVAILETGSWSGRESATCVLLYLCKGNESNKLKVLQEVVIPPLIVVAKSKQASMRAKEKANELLRFFRESRQTF